MVITVSHLGYVKTQPWTLIRNSIEAAWKSSTQVKDQDFIHILKVADQHDILLLFTRSEPSLKNIPATHCVSYGKGRPIVNYLPLNEGEKLTALLLSKPLSKKRKW